MKIKLLRQLYIMSSYAFKGFLIQCICFTFLLAESGKAQKSIEEVYLTIQLNDVKVKQVFSQIEKKTPFSFAYPNNVIEVNSKISLDFEHESLANLLRYVSKNSELGFKRIGKTIHVNVRSEQQSELIESVLADIDISGKITDENGQGLPGASVVVKGTSSGTTSDLEGNYKLSVPEASTIVVSFVGYSRQEILVGAQSTIDVQMEVDATQLEDIVVVGYGTQKKSDLTGAVTSVGSEDIEGIPVQSMDQAIRGKVAGVQVTQRSGAPGGGSIIRIRGINSIQGGNDPLIIVDGFPITGGLDFINPQDIESIEILKDASATAIYGARATNGVIMVTTKKGKSGQMKIDIDSYYGVQDVTKLIDFANAQEYIKIANARAVNDGEAELYFPNPSSITEDTNWQEEIFRSAPIQNHGITLSGGKEELRYSISGNYSDQKGVIKGSDYKRFSLRSNIDVEANERVKVSNSMLLARSARNANGSSPLTAAFRADPTLPVFDQSGNYQSMTIRSFHGIHENPVGAIEGSTRENLETRIFNNLKATFTIIDGLTFSSSIGVDYSTSLRNNYDARFLLAGQPGGKASKSSWESHSLLNENILNYNKKIGDVKLDAVAGYTWQKFKSSNFSAGSSNFVSDDLLFNSLSAGSEISIPSSGGTEWGIASWLGRVNLNLYEKYLLTVSGRADGSSRFADGNKWAFFPSAAFAWRLAEEDWFDVKSISDIKLRASVGQTGNQAVSPFQTLTAMSDVQASIGDAFNVGFAPDGIANKKLKWETTTQYDAGIDIGLLDGKINLSLDYYYKRTNDLLARVDLPLSAGFTSSIQNIGSVSNQGIEIQLGATPVNGDFKWDINANFYKNNNKIIELSKEADVFAPALGLLSTMHILREGEPISQFYGFLWDRIDENGRHVYKDLNDDGMVNDEDRTIIGSPHPSFSTGITNTFSYKNFLLTVQFDGTFGNEVVNASLFESTDSFFKGRNQLKKVVDNYWTPDNPDALYPAPSATVTQSPSDLYLEDASFMKLRYVNLTYSLPVNDIDWIANASIYIAAENLMTFSGYSWYDPEVSNYSSGDLRLGTENGTYPQARTYTIGFKLGF
ncbi:MAG: TonB-dependent receptor [Cyclobacteriaceae bacterium]